MPSSTRASGRFLAVGQSGQTGKRTVLAHPYFKVRRRQGRKQLEKGPLKETKKGTRLALSKRSQLALFFCSVPPERIALICRVSGWPPGKRLLRVLRLTAMGDVTFEHSDDLKPRETIKAKTTVPREEALAVFREVQES